MLSDVRWAIDTQTQTTTECDFKLGLRHWHCFIGFNGNPSNRAPWEPRSDPLYVRAKPLQVNGGSHSCGHTRFVCPIYTRRRRYVFHQCSYRSTQRRALAVSIMQFELNHNTCCPYLQSHLYMRRLSGNDRCQATRTLPTSST